MNAMHMQLACPLALTETEQRYMKIQKEMLAIVFGAERFHQYVYGREVNVESDHKPLELIMKKPLSSAPARIQRLLMRLQKYQVNVQYKPGKRDGHRGCIVQRLLTIDQLT